MHGLQIMNREGKRQWTETDERGMDEGTKERRNERKRKSSMGGRRSADRGRWCKRERKKMSTFRDRVRQRNSRVRKREKDKERKQGPSPERIVRQLAFCLAVWPAA